MKNIMNHISRQGGKALIVGGYVRDFLQGYSSKDIDIEVYGMDADTLQSILEEYGETNAVGKSFGVIKLSCPGGQDFDFSLPRRENKIGRGHKGFQVEPDPTMTPKEAAYRRDFTWNSLAMTRDGEILDHFNGQADLRNKKIRHTSEQFSEDPLRVLRGMQFAARFDMTVANETAEVCRNLIPEFSSLALERVWGEFWKMVSKGIRPSAGLRFLADTGWVALLPELENLIGCPQEPEWHPEGDVWEHTLQTADAAANIAIRENLSKNDRGALVLAAICHDMAKPTCTIFSNGRWRSPGHNDPAIAEIFLNRIGTPVSIRKKVLAMVKEHMVHINPVSERGVRRLLNRINGSASLDDILFIIEADHSGRPPLQGGLPASAARIRDIADNMGGMNAVQPVLKGRHLIQAGFTPGPEIGSMLRQAFEAQLNGQIKTVQDAFTVLGLS